MFGLMTVKKHREIVAEHCERVRDWKSIAAERQHVINNLRAAAPVRDARGRFVKKVKP